MRFLLSLMLLMSLTAVAHAEEGDVADPAMRPVPMRPLRHKRKRHNYWLSRSAFLVSAGGMAFWQKESDGRDFESRGRFQGRLGYSFVGLFDVYAEYGISTTSSSTGGNIDIKDRHEEYLIWLRRMFFEQHLWAPYVAAGVGAQQETITTTFAGSSTRNSGRLQALGSLAGGVRFGGLIQVMLEGRMSFSAGYSPNPEPGLGLQLGLRF